MAELLETTVPAVNSLLQRARLTLRTVTGPTSPGPLTPGPRRRRQVPGSAVTSRSWPRCCARTRSCGCRRRPLFIQGRDRIAAFFAAVPGGRLDLMKLTQTRANGQPALAAYLSDHLGRCQGYGIMVLTVTGGMLSAITGFLGSGMFRHFGLRKPGTLPGYTCITAEQQRPSRGECPPCAGDHRGHRRAAGSIQEAPTTTSRPCGHWNFDRQAGDRPYQDPGPHRDGHSDPRARKIPELAQTALCRWTLGTVAAILVKPRYTGRRCGTCSAPTRPGRPDQHRAGPPGI